MANSYHWNILSEVIDEKSSPEDIVSVLLKNRGLKTNKDREEFLHPGKPEKVGLKKIGLSEKSVNSVVKRIEKAIKNKEKIVVYGDYDADGICATAILWETLYALNADAVPYIPDRFSEGYGINAESVENIKNSKYPDTKLIITVDNGIVADGGVEKANEMAVDVVITDHHEAGKKLPSAYAVVHTTKLSGAGIAWFLSREIADKLKNKKTKKLKNQLTADSSFSTYTSLELAAIGTIADQVPLIGPNRSIAKYGLEALNKTNRPGLLSLFEDAAIRPGEIEAYHVGFVIAPRINAMGRMENAIDSLRLLCTKNTARAKELSHLLNKTNTQRQKVVEDVVLHAREAVGIRKWNGAIVLAHESYHEGIIGLAASRLVEEFYRPAIVISKGEKISKASARSISGFNIIENIRKMEEFLLGGGGHPMAAGFSIETGNIPKFIEEFEKLCRPLLTDDILQKSLRIDVIMHFDLINKPLYETLKLFEPSGLGNPTPTFLTKKVKIIDARTVGRDSRHLKLKLENKGLVFDAIGFGLGERYKDILENNTADIVYTVEENVWNGNTSLQLKLKDIIVN